MRRTPLVPTVLPVLLLAALLLAGCGGSGDGGPGESAEKPTATQSLANTRPDPEPSAGGGSVTELTVDAGAQTGRCAVPTPAIVQGNDLAFDGVVTSVADDGTVTLRPTAVYAGEPGEQVTVTEPSADLQALLAAVDFQQGGRYLVAATGDRVALCTISAAWNPQLAGVYEQAFGAPR